MGLVLHRSGLGDKKRHVTSLQVSDFHFSADNIAHRREYLRSILQDIEECINEQKPSSVDLVFVTGDITQSGQPGEFELAGAFLDRLLSRIGVPKNQLFLVPGNHDVSRSAVSSLIKLARPVLNNQVALNSILRRTSDLEVLLRGLETYRKWANEFLGRQVYPTPEDYYYADIIPINDLKIAVLGINTAIMCIDGNEQRKLITGTAQIVACLDLIRDSDPDFVVALTHHPMNWMTDWDEEACRMQLDRECDLVLHGHLHRMLLNRPSPGQFCVTIGTGASDDRDQFSCAYNFVRVDRETRRACIRQRRFYPLGNWAQDMQSLPGYNGTYMWKPERWKRARRKNNLSEEAVARRIVDGLRDRDEGRIENRGTTCHQDDIIDGVINNEPALARNLIELVQSATDQHVREFCACRIARSQGDILRHERFRSREQLRACAVHDPNEYVRCQLVRTLGRGEDFSGIELLQFLQRALQDPSVLVGGFAFVLSKDMPELSAQRSEWEARFGQRVQSFHDLLRHRNRRLRLVATMLAEHFDAPQLDEILLQNSRHPYDWVRKSAVQAMKARASRVSLSCSEATRARRT